MSLTVTFRRQARKELQEAVDWYEQKRTGLGEQFRLGVEKVLDRICQTPEIHAFAYRDVRCALVPRFPYAVYYRVRRGRLVIIAVLHAKRDPGAWQSRV